MNAVRLQLPTVNPLPPRVEVFGMHCSCCGGLQSVWPIYRPNGAPSNEYRAFLWIPNGKGEDVIIFPDPADGPRLHDKGSWSIAFPVAVGDTDEALCVVLRNAAEALYIARWRHDEQQRLGLTRGDESLKKET